MTACMESNAPNHIRLHLDHCCIQTAADRRYHQVTETLLQAGDKPDSGLVADAELLHEFLKKTDFQKLRSLRPELDGSTDVHVTLRRVAGSFVVKRTRDAVLSPTS